MYFFFILVIVIVVITIILVFYCTDYTNIAIFDHIDYNYSFVLQWLQLL